MKEGYPLKIEATETVVKKIDFNPDFVKNIMLRVDYDALRQAAATLKCPALPKELEADMMEDEKILRLLHHILLECIVMEGNLVCPESGRKFPISKGIPNMLLDEDEV